MSTMERMLGPDFPGLVRSRDSGATQGAQEAENTRRDAGRMGGLDALSRVADILADGPVAPRGIHFHTGGERLTTLMCAMGSRLKCVDGLDPSARSDPERPLFWDGSEFTLPGAGDLAWTQIGPRSFFVAAGMAGLYHYDHRDGRVYQWTLPARPSLPTAVATEIPETQIMALTAASMGVAVGSYVRDTPGWYVFHAINPDPVDGDTSAAGGFRNAAWKTGPLGAGTLQIDTSTVTLADHLYCDLGAGNEVDLESATNVSLTVYQSGVNSLVATPLLLCMGEGAFDEIQIPIPFAAKNQTYDLTFPLSGYDKTGRDAIRYIGFQSATENENVVWVKNLRIGSGLTGQKRYKVRDVMVQGWTRPKNTEIELPSPEAPKFGDPDLEVDAGTSGSQVSVTRAEIPAGLSTWEVYRLDDAIDARYLYVGCVGEGHKRWQPETDVALNATVRPSTLDTGRSGNDQFYYTCTTAGTTGDRDSEPVWPTVAAATVADGSVVWTLSDAGHKFPVLSYADVSDDITDRPKLVQGRVHPPEPATAIGSYDDRLVLFAPAPTDPDKSAHAGCLWLSGAGSFADWHDFGPDAWTSLLASGLIDASSGCRLPMGEAGEVTSLLPLGAWTGAAYTGPLLVSTKGGWFIALQGSAPVLGEGGFSLGHRRRGGCIDSFAACRDGGGLVYAVTPNGDVVSVDRELTVRVLSEAMEPVFRGLSRTHAGRWILGYEPSQARLLLHVGASYLLDLKAGGWDTLRASDYGTPTCAATRPGPGGYLAVGLGPFAAIRKGHVLRLLDPNAGSSGWRWASSYFHAGPRALLPSYVFGDVEGAVSVEVIADGAAVVSGLALGLDPVYLPDCVAKRVHIVLTGAPGSLCHQVAVGFDQEV